MIYSLIKCIMQIIRSKLYDPGNNNRQYKTTVNKTASTSLTSSSSLRIKQMSFEHIHRFKCNNHTEAVHATWFLHRSLCRVDGNSKKNEKEKQFLHHSDFQQSKHATACKSQKLTAAAVDSIQQRRKQNQKSVEWLEENLPDDGVSKNMVLLSFSAQEWSWNRK